MHAEPEQIEGVQKAIARAIATSPVGVGLLLIGGFRYRLLDHSQRSSVDIDYHWSGDLDAKQNELLRFGRRTLLRQIHRQFGLEGAVQLPSGPDADSPNARFLDFRFWDKDHTVEIPIELITIACADPSMIKTADGIVYTTPTDADLIESKLLAIVNRLYLQHRDLVDLFLFETFILPDSPARIRQKQPLLHLTEEVIRKRILDLRQNADYHATAINKVLREQVESATARQIEVGGGGRAVLKRSLEILKQMWPHESS